MVDVSLKTESTAGGITFSTRRRRRFVPASLVGTCVETRALREVLHGNNPVAVALSNTRAPGDWPKAMRSNDLETLKG